MTYEEALNQDIKLSPIQAKNDLERYLLREEKPIPKAVAMGMQALEKQTPKKPTHIHEEYEKHQWKRDEYGNIDEDAFNIEYHNGVVCERCGTSKCVHCEPDYDNDEPCIVDKELCPTCRKEVYRYRKRNYCDECGQKLQWESDTE